jgi:hypothetical protein
MVDALRLSTLPINGFSFAGIEPTNLICSRQGAKFAKKFKQMMSYGGSPIGCAAYFFRLMIYLAFLAAWRETAFSRLN